VPRGRALQAAAATAAAAALQGRHMQGGGELVGPLCKYVES